MKKLSVTLSVLILIFEIISGNAQSPSVKKASKSKNVNVQKPKAISESKYKVGQVWSYRTRLNEKDSFFIVVKVDADPKLGNIIHIALRGLKMKNSNSPDGISDKANHLPFSEKAINESATKLLKEKADLPDYEEGYNLWKEAFDNHRAGIYTITVAKAIDIMEATLNQ